ncbi:oxygen-insensitive NAD(P)H-dependent nitroreductase NfsB [Ravibacter arvi]|uniref:Oxygen-insensitive NAD(P)H-dependent nitroreductase NfsB n=1 Tax=Ravibacter arvi TaxID=2051041 RepID=A0ABP8LTP2_9BACT
MRFLDLANTRYATKKYANGKRISAELIDELKQIIRLSPSSINSQPWRFSFVEDTRTKAALAEVSYFNAQKIKDASHLVVFSVVKQVAHFENNLLLQLPEGSQAYYNNFIKNQPEADKKAWLSRQVYLSLGFFLGASASLGVDSTPMEGIQPDAYADILGLEDFEPLVAVALGYRDTDDANQPEMKPKTRRNAEDVIESVV